MTAERFDATSLGEGQLRLTVPAGASLLTATEFRVCAAGTEANTMSLLARLGNRSAFVSVMARSPLGERVIGEIAASGTDISAVRWSEPGRVGVYFLDPGSDPLPGEVVYDRAHTPFATADESMIDWSVLLNTRVVFLSGVTAGLTANTRALVEHVTRRAHELGVPVAYDVNHRHRLWSAGAAADFLREIAPRVRLLLCPRRDAESLYGLTGVGSTVARELRDLLGVAEVLVSDGAQGVTYAGPQELYQEPAVPVRVRDRPGAGDALAGGFLHGWLAGDPVMGLRAGVRAAALALSRDGDQLVCARHDILDRRLSGPLDR